MVQSRVERIFVLDMKINGASAQRGYNPTAIFCKKNSDTFHQGEMR